MKLLLSHDGTGASIIEKFGPLFYEKLICVPKGWYIFYRIGTERFNINYDKEEPYKIIWLGIKIGKWVRKIGWCYRKKNEEGLFIRGIYYTCSRGAVKL